MYLAGILEKFTELGFIRWEKDLEVENFQAFETTIGSFSLLVQELKESHGRIFKTTKTIYRLIVGEVSGRILKIYDEVLGEVHSPENIMNLFYTAEDSAKIPADETARSLVQELSKQFGFKL